VSACVKYLIAHMPAQGHWLVFHGIVESTLYHLEF